MTMPRSLSCAVQKRDLWLQKIRQEPCKYDYASFFKLRGAKTRPLTPKDTPRTIQIWLCLVLYALIPKHSLLARCKNQTFVSERYAKNHANMTMPRFLSCARCKNETFNSERYAKNHANMTMPRSLNVNPKTFAFGAEQKRDLWLRNSKNHANMAMPRSLRFNPETFAFGAGSLLKLLFLIGNRCCK